MSRRGRGGAVALLDVLGEDRLGGVGFAGVDDEGLGGRVEGVAVGAGSAEPFAARRLAFEILGDAVDEQAAFELGESRIGADLTATKDRLADLDANFGEQQEILELAATLATRCGDAYRKASDRTRKLFNAAVFERLDVKDGRLCHEQYRPPFDDVFNVTEFA